MFFVRTVMLLALVASAAGAQTIVLPAVPYEWKHGANPDQVYLYRNGVQIGGYDYAEGYYRPYDAAADAWGAVTAAPVPPPAKHVFGLDEAKLTPGTGYVHHGPGGPKEITRDQALATIKKKIVDDSRKCRITVIGPGALRQKVLDDLAKAPGLSTWAIMRGYDPGHWAMTGAGFVTKGSPTIYCQAPDGRVLHRQDDYDGGAEALLQALRKAKESYDPKKDPDLRQTIKPAGPVPVGGYLVALVMGACGSSIFLKRKGA